MHGRPQRCDQLIFRTKSFFAASAWIPYNDCSTTTRNDDKRRQVESSSGSQFHFSSHVSVMSSWQASREKLSHCIRDTPHTTMSFAHLVTMMTVVGWRDVSAMHERERGECHHSSPVNTFALLSAKCNDQLPPGQDAEMFSLIKDETKVIWSERSLLFC